MRNGTAMMMLALLSSGQLTAAWAQSSPQNQFDGKWAGQSMKCFPGGQYAMGTIQVKGSQFAFTSDARGVRASCSVKIQADGTFNNSTCDVPTSGRIRGDIMEMHNEMPNHTGSCDKTYKRDAIAIAPAAPLAQPPSAPAGAAGNSGYLQHEPAPGTLAPGMRVLVDDGTCPPGQVNEVSGSPSPGVPRAKRCIARSN